MKMHGYANISRETYLWPFGLNGLNSEMQPFVPFELEDHPTASVRNPISSPCWACKLCHWFFFLSKILQNGRQCLHWCLTYVFVCILFFAGKREELLFFFFSFSVGRILSEVGKVAGPVENNKLVHFFKEINLCHRRLT